MSRGHIIACDMLLFFFICMFILNTSAYLCERLKKLYLCFAFVSNSGRTFPGKTCVCFKSGVVVVVELGLITFFCFSLEKTFSHMVGSINGGTPKSLQTIHSWVPSFMKLPPHIYIYTHIHIHIYYIHTLIRFIALFSRPSSLDNFLYCAEI